jgi:hypothetical protein
VRLNLFVLVHHVRELFRREKWFISCIESNVVCGFLFFSFLFRIKYQHQVLEEIMLANLVNIMFLMLANLVSKRV